MVGGHRGEDIKPEGRKKGWGKGGGKLGEPRKTAGVKVSRVETGDLD